MTLFKKIFFFAFLLLLLGCSNSAVIRYDKYQLTIEEELFLDSLQYKTFLFFWHECNPANGLVKDRSTKDSPSSIAATGFAIPSWAIGAEKKWITREQAAERTLTLLKFLSNSEQSEDKLATGYKGFYYHFLDMQTGQREWNCELSSIDTGLLFAGIIFARNFFNQENENENSIRDLSEKMLNRADWKFFTLPETHKMPYSICLGWTPEDQYHAWGWHGYNEALILYVIAAGLGMENAEQGYKTWLSTYKWGEPYEGLAHVLFPPLFGHQYSHMFIDFRNLADTYLREKGIDYFENSRRATHTQREYAKENSKGWVGYDSLIWGITACDGPGFSRGDKEFLGYAGRGTSGSEYNYFDDGTIAPTAAGGSIAFAPEIVIPTLMNFKKKFEDKGLWGSYGFVDAFNLTADWYGKDYLGIDQGPLIIMIENFRSEFVWNFVMKDPIIITGLKKLGFSKLKSNDK